MDRPFHVVTVGWGASLVESICDRVQDRSAIRFSHIATSTRDLLEFGVPRRSDVHALRDHPAFADMRPDRARLAALEAPDLPTIHNMIESDRHVRELPHERALAYATALAIAFEDAYRTSEPDAVLASFDNLHTAISLAVARQMGIPWYALSFTALPVGFTGACTGLSPSTVIKVVPQSRDMLRALAERTLDDYLNGLTSAPAYVSANTLGLVVRRLPAHVLVLAERVKRVLTGTLDPYTDFSLRHVIGDYVRKRLNVLFRRGTHFVESPPHTPYVFFGFHMQPESSIDVWAPYQANQVALVEAVARSLPPTHELLVKLHISDADSYSKRDIEHLNGLPGVRVVSPFASSRDFLRGASLVVTIMGTMSMEAAFLGKPVLMFGDSKFHLLPSITKAGAYADLPRQIREKLAERPPSREAIIEGIVDYLEYYPPGCYNDWSLRPTDAEIDNLTALLTGLRSRSVVTTGAPVPA